jgi:myo-inositol-1(or 4)-monophosphatase
VDQNLESLLSDIATRAGYLIRSRFGDAEYRRIVKRNPGDVSRRIDMEAEDFIIGELSREGLGGFVFTEERGVVKVGDEARFVVVVDPLDGSLNFVLGIPFYSISIAVGRYRESGGVLDDLVAGVVYDVNNGVLYYGEAGGAVRVRGDEARVDSAMLDKPVASVYVEPNVDSSLFLGLRRIYEELGGFRMRSLGSASLEMTMASMGRFLMFLDLRGRLRLYDIAGAYVIAKAMGARSMGRYGESMGSLPLDPSLRTSVLVTRDPRVMELAAPLLRGR